jgi:DNA polymerase II large subunit
MGQGIIKLSDGGRDFYLVWSTSWDAPVGYGMSLEELQARVREEEGRRGLRELPERLVRVEATGTSFYDSSVDDTIRFNRAGPEETQATRDEIVAHYCRREPWTAVQLQTSALADEHGDSPDEPSDLSDLSG